MTAAAERHPHRPLEESARGVREVAMPPAARALSSLSPIDYEDAFLVEIDPADDRTSEQWARAMLEDAPIFMRRRLRWGWFALGLKLDWTRRNQFVLGWKVRRCTPDLVLLAADGRLGLSGELLFQRRPHALLFATFLRLENPVARPAWAGIAPGHRKVVRYLLERARRGTAPLATMNRDN